MMDDVKKYQLNYLELDTKEREEVLQIIYRKYVVFERKERYFWEKLIDFEAVQDAAAWKIIKEFIQQEKHGDSNFM